MALQGLMPSISHGVQQSVDWVRTKSSCITSLQSSSNPFVPGQLVPVKRCLRIRSQRLPSSSRKIRALSTSDGDKSSTAEEKPGGRFYFNITGFPFPLRPFLARRTIRYEIEDDRIWTFEQEQGLGFSSVTTNTRMTVIKLKSGGLWVHAPIAPTEECIRLIKELSYPVEHIVLPTFAYEHKIFVGPFSREFPSAKVWTAPNQWSWPLNLPAAFFGIFATGGILSEDELPEEWGGEFDFKILRSPEVGIGPYVEVAFFHLPSQTLLVTDAVILVPSSAPEVVPPASLLAAAENGLAVQILSGGKEVPKVEVTDTEEFRQLGWQRMVLQILFFGPGNLLEPQDSFEQISEQLIVSPVVKTLVFEKVPDQVYEWTQSICKDWDFQQIIPCHFAAPIAAGPKEFEAAFSFLDGLVEKEKPSPFDLVLSFFNQKKEATNKPVFLPSDLNTLTSLDNLLVSLGAVKRTDRVEE